MEENGLKEYKHQIAERFIFAIRQIVASKINGCTSVKQVCSFLGEHASNITKMEKGTRFPTIDQIARICESFGISTSWILLNQGEMFGQAPKKDQSTEDRFISLENQIKELRGLIKK